MTAYGQNDFEHVWHGPCKLLDGITLEAALQPVLEERDSNSLRGMLAVRRRSPMYKVVDFVSMICVILICKMNCDKSCKDVKYYVDKCCPNTCFKCTKTIHTH